MGSQLSNFDKKVRRVVPSVKNSRPALNSWMSRLAYASSSGVHFPRRRGGPFFLLLLEEPPPLVEVGCGWGGGRCAGTEGADAEAAPRGTVRTGRLVLPPVGLTPVLILVPGRGCRAAAAATALAAEPRTDRAAAVAAAAPGRPDPPLAAAPGPPAATAALFARRAASPAPTPAAAPAAEAGWAVLVPAEECLGTTPSASAATVAASINPRGMAAPLLPLLLS